MKLHAGYMMNVMKSQISPIKLFLAGAVCVILGFILPLLIIIGIIENSFALSFLIYLLQLVGMILGVIAAAGLAVGRLNKQKAKRQAEQDEQEGELGWMK